jgi:hypothetical protein
VRALLHGSVVRQLLPLISYNPYRTLRIPLLEYIFIV